MPGGLDARQASNAKPLMQYASQPRLRFGEWKESNLAEVRNALLGKSWNEEASSAKLVEDNGDEVIGGPRGFLAPLCVVVRGGACGHDLR